MGRSRAVSNSADEDGGHRAKRRKAAPSGETSEPAATGPGASEGKKALYHCNYCNKDISGKIRIKCTKCPDFDLCVECFSVGAEVTPHKSNHPYRVMDNLSFPLICSDWNADEEILLLEGIEMYGLGNWAEIAEHVGTKMKAQCIDHYMSAYMHSPCHPLPDMSHINGKNRKDLLAMAKVQGDGKKGLPVLGDIAPKEESPFSPTRVKIEDSNGEHPTGRSSSGLTGVSKKGSSMGHLKDSSDATKVEGLVSDEGLPMDRSVGAKKPKYSGDEGSSMTKLSGYNPKREEFDPEYDNDAELSLAEMEFKENESETEREIKLRVLRIYLSRLDERKRRKEFILERNLLNPNPLEKELSNEDKEVLQRLKVFMRFLSQAEYKALVESAIEERRIRRKIQELQECRAAGCRTLAEAKAFTEQKRKKEMTQKAKENGLVRGGPGRPPLSRESDVPITTPESHKTHGGGGGSSEITGTCSIVNSTPPFEEYWDITGLPGADLLSETEQQLCCENRLLPSHYLKMQEVLLQEILKGGVANSGDAHRLFKISPSKVDSVFNVVRKKLGHVIGSPNDND